MELLNESQMLKRPAGTLFSLWEDDLAHGLFRKGENLADDASDFYVSALLAIDRAGWPGVWRAEQKWSNTYNGVLYLPLRFAVYEPEDLEVLLVLLGAR